MPKRPDFFCCCEYVNDQGNRSHIMATCCDCEVVDETFERFITCRKMPPDTCSKAISAIFDRLRIPWCDGHGARRIKPEVALAAIVMPVFMIIAAQGWVWTLISFASLPFCLLFLYVQCSRSCAHSYFCLAWSLTSLLFLLGIFQFEVVPYLEILFSENLMLMSFVTIMCVCAYLTRLYPGVIENDQMDKNNMGSYINNESITVPYSGDSQSKCPVCNIIQPLRCSHCKVCGHCILQRDHHCVWLDTCIGVRNHKYFIIGLITLVLSCCYGANLTLTTICHPTLFWGLLLLPDNCSDVYGDIHIALCFVSAVYSLGIAALTICVLLQQTWLICHNTTVQEWKQGRTGNYSKGIICNCLHFWCSFH